MAARIIRRMTSTVSELIELLSLERLEDYEYEGRPVLASRLGYRMTDTFARRYFGRIFLHPHVVFTEEMLKPELQDPAVFAESMDVIVATHQRVAQAYLDDGTIALAVPPLRALLEIMATGRSAEGWDLDSPQFRAQFTAESVLAADWYRERLDAKQAAASGRAAAGLAALQRFLATPGNEEPSERLGIAARIEAAKAELAKFSSQEWRERLVGTVGGQPL